MPRSSSMGSVATQTNQLILMTLHEERAFSKTGSTLACDIITPPKQRNGPFSFFFLLMRNSVKLRKAVSETLID